MQKEKKRLFLDHPIFFAVIGAFLALFGKAVLGSVVYALFNLVNISGNTASNIAAAIGNIALGALILWLTKRPYDKSYRFFAHNDHFWLTFAMLWPLLAASVVANLLASILAGNALAGTGVELVSIAVEELSVGFVEEAVFRGAVLTNTMRVKRGSPNQIAWAVVLSSIPFGLFHIINASGSAGLYVSLFQVLYAAAVGALFAAVYLRTRCLLACVVVHGIVDVTNAIFVDPNPSALSTMSIAFYIILTVSSIACSAYYLRGEKRAAVPFTFDGIGD